MDYTSPNVFQNLLTPDFSLFPQPRIAPEGQSFANSEEVTEKLMTAPTELLKNG
jgi:hypothetical protein